MESSESLDVVTRLMDEEGIEVSEIVSLLQSSPLDIAEAAEAYGESADYVIEKMLETVASSPADYLDQKTVIDSDWLRLEELPNGTKFEVNVQAAEALAAMVRHEGIDTARLHSLAENEDWRKRLVCAWTVRDMDTEDAAKIKESLAQDPFVDDDGFYLVREGAGFHED